MARTTGRKGINHETTQSTAWMVTLADLLALIITFFVLLYSMSSVVDYKWKTVSKSLSQRMSNSFITPLTALPTSDLTVERVNLEKGDNLRYLLAVLTDKINVLPDLGALFRINLLEDRLVISMLGHSSFSPGSAELPAKAVNLITFIGQTLSTVRNSLEIVSYADPSPIQNNTYPSNWELSLHRAYAVSETLKKSGYPYTVRSFGRSSSLFEDLSTDIPVQEREELSRRIDIIVRGAKATY